MTTLTPMQIAAYGAFCLAVLGWLSNLVLQWQTRHAARESQAEARLARVQTETIAAEQVVHTQELNKVHVLVNDQLTQLKRLLAEAQSELATVLARAVRAQHAQAMTQALARQAVRDPRQEEGGAR